MNSRYDTYDALRTFPPRFQDPMMEGGYRAYFVSSSLLRARIAISLAIGMYLGFGILDRLLDEPAVNAFLEIRVAFAFWLCLVLYASTRPIWRRFSQEIIGLTAILGSSGIALMILIAEHDITRTTFFAGNILVMMFASGFGLLGMSIAFWSTLLSAVVTVVAVSLSPVKSGVMATNAVFVLAAVVTATASSLILELTERQNWQSQQTILSQRDTIEAERQRADDLLRNILPDPIAMRLKNGERPIADGFNNVTVLFADVESFTPLAERLGPKRLVELLDDLFSTLDAIAARLGIEKVKTLGDAYMAVCGAPDHVTDHAWRSVVFAAEIVNAAAEVGIRHGAPIRIRVGLNTGPVVAGVIGRQRIIYDLWGDTVNIAQRIEGQGLVGMVTLSTSTFDEVCDKVGGHARHVILKGKGQETVFDTAVKDILAAHAAPLSVL